jgi:hypothetical protein
MPGAIRPSEYGIMDMHLPSVGRDGFGFPATEIAEDIEETRVSDLGELCDRM